VFVEANKRIYGCKGKSELIEDEPFTKQSIKKRELMYFMLDAFVLILSVSMSKKI
jgi:hypothetical protein